MKPAYKTACILIDEHDLEAFRGPYGDALPDEFCWFSLGYLPMMQVVLQDVKEKYYIPQIIEEDECSLLTKRIYQQSQDFLRQLCLANNIVNTYENSFPLEYFWLTNWIGTYRILAKCNDLLNQCPVKKIVLIERNKPVNVGGLLTNMASFTDLIRDFFENKGVKVRCLDCKDCSTKPRTIFYSQNHNWKVFFLHALRFARWKALSFNKKNHDYILIMPGYDNCINYSKTFMYSSHKSFPQVFHGEQIPFLHSWSKLLRFLIARVLFKRKFSNYTTPIIKSYRCNFFDFEFDFSQKFHSTIVQYLSDVRWMKNYIDLFWNTCLDACKRYLTIFSLCPVHLHSYFLVKKTKDANGKVAVWQHGGLYSYADHFIYYVQDYKTADYFLSFGRCNFNDVTKFAGDSCAVCVPVGSNIFTKPHSGNSKIRNLLNTQGLYIPAVIAKVFYCDNRIKWNEALQFGAMKQTIDFFGSGAGGNLAIKGLRGLECHLKLRSYIEKKRYKSISYIDISTGRALSGNPKFVILDSPSTPLIEALTQYTGPVFLMNNQESFAIREDALSLLKRRVVYSQCADELEAQLINFFKTGLLEGVDVEDNSFVDVYVKRFCYREYERFLKIGTQSCQS